VKQGYGYRGASLIHFHHCLVTSGLVHCDLLPGEPANLSGSRN